MESIELAELEKDLVGLEQQMIATNGAIQYIRLKIKAIKDGEKKGEAPPEE